MYLELPERKTYTVSEFTREIQDLLEGEFTSVWIQGEVSNCKKAPSGHHYFTLKDETSQIPCVMFKPQSRYLKFKLEDGLQILCWGRVTVYGARGVYQLSVDTIEPVGLGGLMLAFEQLRQQLAAEGLFDASRKKPLPKFPKTIGLVTSSTGAAVRDMVRILRRRFRGVNIIVSSASVQGGKAPVEIEAAIQRLCECGEVDVVIVGRGGGSIEDLRAFNHEKVVRAVANCPLPIISAVGHETDYTLTDFAADLRASTPSTAAELAVPDKRELEESICGLRDRMRALITTNIKRQGAVLDELTRRLYDPRRRILEKRQTLDDLTLRLMRASTRKMESHRKDLISLTARLRPEKFREKLTRDGKTFEDMVSRLMRCGSVLTKRYRDEAQPLMAKLGALNPLAVLERGYSITFSVGTKKVITSASQVGMGADVQIRVSEGDIFAKVTGRRLEDTDESPEQASVFDII